MGPRNILLTVQYDGARYCGWQRQPQALSVQQLLEEALAPIEGGPVRLRASGRTDAGVHARGQTANFVARSDRNPETFLRAANSALGHDVAVVGAVEVPPGFDARRDARLRWYRYRMTVGGPRPVFGRAQRWFVPGRLDARQARRAAELFLGRHDFSGFRSSACSARRTTLDIEDCSLRVRGRQWTLDLRCRSFLHNMARILAGAIVGAARGRLSLEDIQTALGSGRRDRRIVTAPPHGLTLMAVGYPPEALRLPIALDAFAPSPDNRP
jgi:tRNA pseudouridine38-40 synthase